MDLSSDLYIPLIVDDICVSKDKFCGKVKYFMASEKKEQFFKLNEVQYNFFLEFIPYALEEHNITKLEEKCRVISNGKISLQTIIKMLDRYHLFEKEETKIKSKVTIDYNSKKFVEVKLDGLNNYQKQWKILFYIIFTISFVIIGASMIEIFFYHDNIYKIVNGIKFSMDTIRLKSIVAVVIIVGLSVILHEMGHLLTAQVLGIEWKSITVSFVWGLNPIFYVRYKNFCIHKSKNKVKVLLMGMFLNFIQILVYMQLSIITRNGIFVIGMILNAGCIINSVMPLGTSDGYQILAIILGIEGARWKALTMIGQVFNRPKEVKNIINKKDDLIFIIYILIAYITGIFGCIELLKSVLHFLNLISVKNETIITIVTLFFAISTMAYLVKFFRNVSAIKL